MITANKNAASGGVAAPIPADDANRTNRQGRADMHQCIYTINEASDKLSDIAATDAEIITASGWALAELESAAVNAGHRREEYRRVPMFTAAHIDQLRRRILTERAELSGIDAELESITDDADESVSFEGAAARGLAPTPAGWQAPLDQLKKKAVESAKALLVAENDRATRGHRPPLPYMTTLEQGHNLNISSDRYRTPNIAIPLSLYDAYWAEGKDDDTVSMAAMRIGLFQYGDQDYPLIEFERRVGMNGLESGAQARYELSLDEAEQLAHTLLLLLDVARGCTDQSNGGAQ